MNNKDLKSLEIKKLIESFIVYKDYMTIDLIGIFLWLPSHSPCIALAFVVNQNENASV